MKDNLVIALLSVIGIALIILKLTHVIAWSWWLIFIPLYCQIFIGLSLFICNRVNRRMKNIISIRFITDWNILTTKFDLVGRLQYGNVKQKDNETFFTNTKYLTAETNIEKDICPEELLNLCNMIAESLINEFIQEIEE